MNEPRTLTDALIIEISGWRKLRLVDYLVNTACVIYPTRAELGRLPHSELVSWVIGDMRDRAPKGGGGVA